MVLTELLKYPSSISGTFFGMRPCGIILFAYELFICESKSQVYGILHDVMSKWEFNETSNVLEMEMELPC